MERRSAYFLRTYRISSHGRMRTSARPDGRLSPVTSLDPHFHNLTPDNTQGRHVFETLVT